MGGQINYATTISWNREEIRGILDSRINHLVRNQYQGTKVVTLADVFNFKVNDLDADLYILERTMLRPRDAISFVNLCLGACDGKVELNEDIILEAEEKFYSGRKKALVKEWASIYFHIESYLDSLSFIPTNEFKVSDISQAVIDQVSNYLLDIPVVKDDEEHDRRAMDVNELIKVWFAVGVIGIKKSSTLFIYSSFEKPELDITDLNKRFVIHPLFFRNT